MAKKAPKSTPAEKPSFEQSLDKLERIVHQLEEGEIGLAESLARYETGVKTLRRCYDLLERAERRIELLSGVDADGNPITTPMDDEALSLEEKASSRGRRRSAPGKRRPAGDPDTDRTGELF